MRMMEVHYEIFSNQRNEFYNSLINLGIDVATKKENGNLKYDFYFNPSIENEVLLLEIWDTLEDIETHLKGENYKKLSELKNKYVEKTTITKYDIGSVI